MTGHCLLVVAKSLAMFSNTFGLVVSRFMSSCERFAGCINFKSKLFDMDNNSNHAPSIKKPILVAYVPNNEITYYELALSTCCCSYFTYVFKTIFMSSCLRFLESINFGSTLFDMNNNSHNVPSIKTQQPSHSDIGFSIFDIHFYLNINKFLFIHSVNFYSKFYQSTLNQEPTTVVIFSNNGGNLGCFTKILLFLLKFMIRHLIFFRN